MTAPRAEQLPTDFNPGAIGENEVIDPATTKHVKWTAKLGSQSYGNTVVAGGRVYVGTNNAWPRDSKYQGDRATLYCFDEKTGEFIWQLVVPKLGAGKVSDWEYLGICSSPAVEGDRLYLVTNRCEIVCLDTRGMADGNQGVTDEPQYTAGPGKPPIPQGPTDADVIWRYDMRDELGVFPHNIASNSPLVVGDYVYVATSNGVDWSHTNIPNPRSPALIALDKKTGELAGEEMSDISKRMLHCNWASPAYTEEGGAKQIVWGGGDGWCYGFAAKPVVDEDGYGELKELWRFDCNPPRYRTGKDGKPIKYATPDGPSECIGTPIIYNGKAYIAIGQDPEHGEGVGSFSCIDISKRGDITQTGKVWQYTGIDRSISTAGAADGLVYIADYAGVVHCLDAENGTLYWKHDTGSHIWGSTLLADGKVYLGNEDKQIVILAHGKEKKIINVVDFGSQVYSTPIVANGVMYISTQTHLYAIQP